MALTKEQKHEFSEKVAEFKVYLEELKKELNVYKTQLKKNPEMTPYYYVAMAINAVKVINTNLLMNDLSVSIQGINVVNYLETAKKEISNAISYIEQSVGNDIDGSLNDNREKLDKITRLSHTQRLNFIKALQECTKKTIAAFGPNSKWKFSWPDVHYRVAGVAKNLFDFREFEKGKDLDNPDYYVQREHFNLIISLANFAAQEYRSKFDLSTQNATDLKSSIAMLDLNRKIMQITGENEDLEKTKTLIESLKNKVEDLETSDEEKKKKKKK
ncbi:MAG: hypothetical protein O9346_15945 [Leptospiraceae bacterium]|jgi:hypothetical protein|nr:hypothetical protein [Leptospiraceae bacterium]MCZ8347904.1 hypothetical protein [Leptospiraceae bacterium]PJE01120.1 MAG: hypothetical protein CK427_11840 [Leptospira sp.]